MPKKKNMTIEDLAVMTQKGFTELRGEMRAGFDAVDKRFVAVEADVGILKMELREVKMELKELRKNTNKVLSSLDKFIAQMAKQKQEHIFLTDQVKRLEKRIEKLEAKKT